VLANKGGGRFGARLEYRTGRGPHVVAIGDLNRDGKPDLATAGYDAGSVSVLLNKPGLCTVQYVKGQTLPVARRTIARANCRVGKIRRAYSKTVKRGRVISQKPKFGVVLQGGGKVNLVVSRGRIVKNSSSSQRGCSRRLAGVGALFAKSAPSLLRPGATQLDEAGLSRDPPRAGT
jgi:hypothetical protein